MVTVTSDCDYAFDYWGKGTTVTVTSATTTAPDVFPLIQCGSGTGNLFTLGCLATGFTPSSLTFKWTKGGTPLTDFIQYPPVQKENAYTGVSQIQVSSQDWNNGQRYKCLVEHSGVNKETADIFKKPELYQLPSLKVYASTPSEVHNEASFSCYAKDFAPEVYTIKWLKNDVEIQDKPHVTPVEKKVLDNGTLYTVASFLTIKSDELANSKITCDFEGMAAQNVKGSVNASLIYQPPPPSDCSEVVDIQIIAPKMEDLFVNRKGSVVCQVRTLKPSVERIYWENQNGKEMATNPVPSSNGNTKSYRLSLDITFDEWSQGVELYCVVVHSEAIDPIKKLYQRIPGRPTQRPSVFMLPPVEDTRKEMVTLTCYVKDFFPQELYVSWLVDDQEADSTYKFSTTDPIRDNGSYFVYGHLSLTLDQWKNSDVVYSCVVYHESLVNATKAIVRSIGYRTFEKTNLVNLNMNIPETCKPQ
ncbi:hypothetical protein Q5P01_017490 [Channa striata]|uniref:Ig-like domain-containing protein n=1 Tax=Channa striata TaxID=64152 RepID=A0AA88SDV5_CHASR|nr:hypothetical protein Q5P01_017490 [Channa striata]